MEQTFAAGQNYDGGQKGLRNDSKEISITTFVRLLKNKIQWRAIQTALLAVYEVN